MICKLLTPGPLSTTNRVKEQMLEDRCTWDNDYKLLTLEIRKKLLTVAGVKESNYSTVLMQGSGSYVVESLLTSAIRPEDRVLFITNGAYGKRMVQMAEVIGLSHKELAFPYDEVPSEECVLEVLENDVNITHIAMVHCETTTGMLNPIETIGQLAKRYNKLFIVDAMSSFGGVPISFERANIDFLVSSANKCIHGVPGFGFIIAKREQLERCKGVARSLSLDIYDQWKVMEKDGKWRFTSPTHVVGAFREALRELDSEGGVPKRYAHYSRLNKLIRKELNDLGFESYVDKKWQSPIITTFYYPNEQFDFNHFYKVMKQQGFILYPGKLTKVDTFRIGNIGDITEDDVKRLIQNIKQYMGENK